MIACLLLSAALTLAAAADADKSPAVRLKAIEADVASAQAAYEKARAQVEDGDRADPAVDALYDVAVRKRLAGFAAAWEIAERDPGSDAGFAVLPATGLASAARSGVDGLAAVMASGGNVSVASLSSLAACRAGGVETAEGLSFTG